MFASEIEFRDQIIRDYSHRKWYTTLNGIHYIKANMIVPKAIVPKVLHFTHRHRGARSLLRSFQNYSLENSLKKLILREFKNNRDVFNIFGKVP